MPACIIRYTVSHQQHMFKYHNIEISSASQHGIIHNKQLVSFSFIQWLVFYELPISQHTCELKLEIASTSLMLFSQSELFFSNYFLNQWTSFIAVVLYHGLIEGYWPEHQTCCLCCRDPPGNITQSLAIYPEITISFMHCLLYPTQ